MTLEQVKQEIINNAQAQGSALLADAKKQAKADLAQAHDAIATIEHEMHDVQEADIAALDRRYAATMKLQARKILFEAKKDLLTDVFGDLRGKVAKLPKAQREKILAQLFAKAKKQVGVGRVYCAKADLSYVKKKLAKNAQATDIIGGIIVESKDASLRVDYSFNSLVGQLEEKRLQEVAGILFP